MFSLKGITLIVTGAGSGMGRELTFRLLKKGASVAACDINETTLKETAALAPAGGRIRTYAVNVADTQKASALPGLVKKELVDKLYRLMPVKAIDMMAKRVNKMIQ